MSRFETRSKDGNLIAFGVDRAFGYFFDKFTLEDEDETEISIYTNFPPGMGAINVSKEQLTNTIIENLKESDLVKYFKLLKNSAEQLNLNELSIGMSGDYEKALDNHSTFIRLGTAIFGSRKLVN